MREARSTGLLGTSCGVAGVLAAMASCSVAALDLTGKACPCTEGYVCNAANVCVLGTVPGGPPQPPAPDAGVPPAPLVVVSALSSPWQTANTIRWSWTVDGAASSFLSYEITWADALAKVESGAGVTVIGSAQKPELGAFDARGGKTSGPVDIWTTTHGHGAGKEYFAKLTVRDKNGTASTMIASARTTAAPTTARVLFDGTKQATATPQTFEFRAPAGEEAHYFFKTECGAGVAACATHLELGGIGRDLAAPEFTEASFDVAFLEARLVGNIATSGFTTGIAIEPAGCTQGDELCQWRFSGWSQPGGVQPVLQVPLRELENAGGKLTYAALRDKGFRIAAFALSGTWKDTSTLRLYDARIRW